MCREAPRVGISSFLVALIVLGVSEVVRQLDVLGNPMFSISSLLVALIVFGRGRVSEKN